jgi:division protein CdvB (Snf7/Vps24/ESCRT-III family)
MPTDTLTKQIEDKMLELEELAKKGELARCILAELEVNRLLHERTKLILDDLGVKLEDLNKKLNKIFKNSTNSVSNNTSVKYERTKPLEERSFLSLIKDKFKK